MAIGYRTFRVDFTGESYGVSDVRDRARVMDAFADWVAGLGIGWTIHDRYYTSTNYTATSTYYHIFLRFRNSDHLIRLTNRAGAISTTSYTQMNIYVMAKDLDETTILATMNGTVQLVQNNSGGPNPYGMTAAVWFGGDKWSVFNLESVSTITPDPYAGNKSRAFGGFALEDVADDTVTTEQVGVMTSVNLNQYLLTWSYRTGSDISPPFSASFGDTNLPNNLDFEFIRDAVFYNTRWKFPTGLYFSNSQSWSTNTVFDIDGDKYILFWPSSLLLKIEDPPVA